MKKLLSLSLAMLMVLSLAGCSLFSDTSVINFDDVYTHTDPDGLKYDERTALRNTGFGATIEDTVNSMAYPDTLLYGDDGSILGMYDYDPATGLAYGWTSFTTGEYTAYAAGEEVELGLPDESMMVSVGDVTMAAVVYGNGGTAVECDYYLFLSDAAVKDDVIAVMADYYGLTFAAESDTVLKCVKDAAAIDDEFTMMEGLYGEVYDDRSATSYADLIKMLYALRPYGAVNPYKPYEGAADPEGLTYDEKIVLTGAGSYSLVDEELEKDLKCRTDVVYGYEGKAVSQVTYYEFGSAATVEALMADTYSNFLGTAEAVTDTVICETLDSARLASVIESYKGYGMLSDDSAETYATYLEECYFSMRYEQ